MQGYLPKSYLEPVPPLTTLIPLWVKHLWEGPPSNITISVRKGLVTPVPPILMVQEPSVSVPAGTVLWWSDSSWEVSMIITAPARPVLELGGERVPSFPQQPVTSAAASHHPVCRRPAAFAEWSIKYLLFIYKLLPSVCWGNQFHRASGTKAIKSPHQGWSVLPWVCIWAGDSQ